MSDRGKVRGSFFWLDSRAVGQGQSQGKFFLVGRSDGDYLVGRSDGGRTEVFTSL